MNLRNVTSMLNIYNLDVVIVLSTVPELEDGSINCLWIHPYIYLKKYLIYEYPFSTWIWNIYHLLGRISIPPMYEYGLRKTYSVLRTLLSVRVHVSIQYP
jgi:hypothetical protein